MELFRVNNGSWNKFGETPKNLRIDAFKLRKAMELNNLLTHISQDEEKPVEDEHDVNRKVGFWNRASKMEQCGFWGLPSFINHSCFPNAKCMVVGKAMFIIAVREIAAGEEITVSYFRNFVPLVERESHFIHLGFRCKCKRCVLEGFLDPSFEQLSHIIQNFYNSLFDQAEPTNVSSRDIQSMVGFAVQLENIDAQSKEKHLIRASFSCIYKYVYAAAMKYPDFSVLLRLLPTKLEVAESLRHADPSSPISLELFQMLVEEVHGQERDLLLQKTMENGIAVFGKQKEDVLKALVESRFVMRFQTVRTGPGIPMKFSFQ
ncbi:hypothetical protein SUGI_1093070 [Cryptomeria japonica]|uniref:uncharacterized protein LOC131039205 n=1 Tax=Cryptomeria japonica TaxID=3369 RepID=UPI002414BCB6|nr:uncharacterized protein LOC131039205 [Cryptomeria japonica]GLJ51434.1 hypothetical protein SUGI_1093070 [Cryptomeria japonica]